MLEKAKNKDLDGVKSEMNKIPENTRKIIFKYGAMVIACFITGLCINMFRVPHRIVTGGITGLATLINLLVPELPIGVMTFAINIPILLIALKKEGWRFVLDSLLTVFTMSLFTDLTVNFPSPTNDVLLASVYAGLTSGLAMGLYIKYRVSSGGTEMLARVIQHKFPALSIQTMVAVLDIVIVVAGAFALNNPENLLYVLIIIFITTKVSDIVIMGFSHKKLCYIITNYPDEVSALMLAHLKCGITKMDGVGMYTGSTHSILMTAVRLNQISQIRNLLKYVDSHAFLIVSDASEVYGKNFTPFSGT